MRFVLIAICSCICLTAAAQTLGGNAAYNFVKLPATPLLTASGGVNASYAANDAGLAANNPALLMPTLHSQLQLAFNHFPGGIKTLSLNGAYAPEQSRTAFGGQVYFVDYGPVPQTDAAGNGLGTFRPVDFVVQASAAQSYLDKWRYGATLKFIHSDYGQYRSGAVAADVGIHYADSGKNFYAGLIARNMGFQFKTYAGEAEDLPFGLEIGITKRLAKAPLGFSFTAQHLQRFDILYNDTNFIAENDLASNDRFVSKLLNHFVVATHLYLGKNLEATLGYNHLRRSELNTGASGNGLNGFSMGLRLLFAKLQVQYARANYQSRIAYNQLGITLQLNRLFGLGTTL